MNSTDRAAMAARLPYQASTDYPRIALATARRAATYEAERGRMVNALARARDILRSRDASPYQRGGAAYTLESGRRFLANLRTARALAR